MSSSARAKGRRGIVAALLLIHASLLAWGALRHSPTWDEVGHMAAGLTHWKLGRFEAFCVNPPLVRMVATLPVLAARPEIDWSPFDARPGARMEFLLGGRFVAVNQQRSFWLFTLARWACIPFSLLGGYMCFRWASELYGHPAGIVALSLWCFSPTVLAHAQLITPDAAATAMGLTAAYLFWRWLKGPTWGRAVAAGVALGLAELTKTTWIVLFPWWPLLWIVWSWPARGSLQWPQRRRQAMQMIAVLIMGIYLINFGYGFKGSFRKLGDLVFFSEFLSGREGKESPGQLPGNRFAESWLGTLPIPLPDYYVMGIDRQKSDFERKMWSYLRGEWRKGGWWYYYLYAAAIKVPLGTWLLIFLAPSLGLFFRGYSASRRDELVLLSPAVVVLVLVSSQTGFSHHLRYVLPCFPFAFIWASKVARAVDLKHWLIASLAAIALAWSVGSSLYYYPHSLSYFNELVGGPKGGHAHLLDSNIDWGQDLLYLKRWLDEHPEAQPLGLAYSLPPRIIDPRIARIEYTLPPPGPDAARSSLPSGDEELGPQPGWYAIFVTPLRDRLRRYEYFLHFEPVAMVGYSAYIYHITLGEANRVRRELELPELPDDWQPARGGEDG